MTGTTIPTSAEFTQHIRFALLHLYEINTLEQGPARALAGWMAQIDDGPADMPAGQRLHTLLARAIERMKPQGAPDVSLPSHRNYLILKRRYIDRIPLPQLEAEFSSSSRQFRRDNHRAIEALVLTLGQLSARQNGQAPESTATSEELTPFSRSIGPVDVWSLVTDASRTLSAVISSAGIAIRTNIQPDLPTASADRAALRLALIKSLWLAITWCPGEALTLHLSAGEDEVILTLAGLSGIPPDDAACREASRLTSLAGGELRLLPADDGAQGSAQGSAQNSAREQHIRISLPRHRRPVVMVIDDDPAMPRIIERYLALQPVQVIGCKSTDDVIGRVKQHRPAVILLDILMPQRDGWEVLQELKADPETYHLNLAVCSIWDERDLALTLGADAFFQKPIDRAALLEYIGAFIQIPGV